MAKNGQKSDPTQVYKVLAFIGFVLVQSLLFWICYKGYVQGTYSNPHKAKFSITDDLKPRKAGKTTAKVVKEPETEQKLFDEWMNRRSFWFYLIICLQVPLGLAIMLQLTSTGKHVGEEAEEISRGMVR